MLFAESFAFWARGLEIMASTLGVKMAWVYAVVPAAFAMVAGPCTSVTTAAGWANAQPHASANTAAARERARTDLPTDVSAIRPPPATCVP